MLINVLQKYDKGIQGMSSSYFNDISYSNKDYSKSLILQEKPYASSFSSQIKLRSHDSSPLKMSKNHESFNSNSDVQYRQKTDKNYGGTLYKSNTSTNQQNELISKDAIKSKQNSTKSQAHTEENKDKEKKHIKEIDQQINQKDFTKNNIHNKQNNKIVSDDALNIEQGVHPSKISKRRIHVKNDIHNNKELDESDTDKSKITGSLLNNINKELVANKSEKSKISEKNDKEIKGENHSNKKEYFENKVVTMFSEHSNKLKEELISDKNNLEVEEKSSIELTQNSHKSTIQEQFKLSHSQKNYTSINAKETNNEMIEKFDLSAEEDNLENKIFTNLTKNSPQFEKGSQRIATHLKTQGNNDLVQQAKLVLNGGKDGSKGEIKIALHPREFGDVKMSFQIDNNRIVGRILVSSEIAKDAMQKNMDNLARQFQHEGYEVEGFFVSVDSNTSENNNEDQLKRQFKSNNRINLTELSNQMILREYIGTISDSIDFIA